MTLRFRPPSGSCWSGRAIKLSPPATAGGRWISSKAAIFDLLFLDIFMPGMDGFETMRLVRQRYPSVQIIVISGHSIPSETNPTPDFLTMARKLGAVRSLQKPFRPDALLQTVAACLEDAKRSSSSRTAGNIASGS
jgi:CheY-like chemotaxis protein